MWKVNFNLNKPSQLEANAETNGMKVSISQGSDQLVVEFTEACDEDDAHEKALKVASQFLDVLWKSDTYLSIDLVSQVIEYISPISKSIAITPPPASCVASTGPVKLEIKDSSGNILEEYDSSKPGTIEVKPSEAASYYRHAHLTNDPFDKFHDLYLVAENVASKMQTAKRFSKNKVKQFSESGESYEEGLLYLALDECFSSNQQSLKRTAKHLAEFDESKETIPQVAKILYKEFRCQLSHAKAPEDKKIPFNSEDIKEVKTALPLMEFVARSLLQYEEDFLL